jgi:SRSO17 transposase
MERRFAARMQEALEGARVDPRVFRDVQPRLEKFLEPFVARLQETEQQAHARNYVRGLLSDLKRKNVESVAYLHDQDRLPLQKFIGCSPWHHAPLLSELASQVGAALGEADGVIVFDPSAHPKKGTESVGVQRQWCGRLGKIDNCQVGVYMGYVSRVEQALVDVRLYLPESWASDKKRRAKAGVPKEVRFQTRHELALAMLDDQGPLLSHSWVSGDDEMGRSTFFRRELQGRNERYLLMVPSNTLVRDLEAELPPYGGRGPRPQAPFVRVDRWAAELQPSAWATIEIRTGEKGPLIVEAVKRRVAA